jgi:hypothetical protein
MISYSTSCFRWKTWQRSEALRMLHKVIMDGKMDWTQLYSYEFLLSHLKVKWTTCFVVVVVAARFIALLLFLCVETLLSCYCCGQKSHRRKTSLYTRMETTSKKYESHPDLVLFFSLILTISAKYSTHLWMILSWFVSSRFIFFCCDGCLFFNIYIPVSQSAWAEIRAQRQ